MPLMTSREAVNLHWATRPDAKSQDAPVCTRPLSEAQIAHNVRYIQKFYTFGWVRDRQEDSVAYAKLFVRIASRTSDDVVIVSVYYNRETAEYEHFCCEETTAWVKAFGEKSYVEAARERVAAIQAKKQGVN